MLVRLTSRRSTCVPTLPACLYPLSKFIHSSCCSRKEYDYDLVVIGGGSGGLACSKEAAQFGKKVAVLDYVSSSPQGSAWGLGGTCVNVGCIPKKLMHQAALLGSSITDAGCYGWDVKDSPSHSWDSLTAAIGNHIKSLNWGHRVQLKEKNVDYLNARGSFIDAHTVQALSESGSKSTFSAEHIVIAVGGRPSYPSNVPGAYEHGITSDDLFFHKTPPGKTLVVGASYVALECAGILAGLGYSTSLMVRSRPLKSFDQDMASLVLASLKGHGVNILPQCQPTSVEKSDSCEKVVSWSDHTHGQTFQDSFDTVLFATGRQASTGNLALSNARVVVDPGSKKIIVNEQDATTVCNIHAIGDAAYGRPELTPVAVQAGKLLARRLFGGSNTLMNYELVPTTVFTPIEFACVGLSEEAAIGRYGNEGVEVYHAFYTPLEYYLPNKDSSQCYVKMVCLRGDADNDGTEKVLGLHLIGPNAGEVVQGFAAAMIAGLTRADLEATVGIHPTCAEEIVKLHITKRSGVDPRVTGC